MEQSRVEEYELRSEEILIENEVSDSAEAMRLYGELEYSMAYAQQLGMMTEREAEQWRQGFMACDQLEHMENLVSLFSSEYVASGEEVLDKLDTLLSHRLITENERTSWLAEISMVTFDEKQQRISFFENLLGRLAQLEQDLNKVIGRMTIAEQALWRNRFFSASGEAKAEVVKQAGAVRAPRPERARVATQESDIQELLNQGDFRQAEYQVRSADWPIFQRFQWLEQIRVAILTEQAKRLTA
jgi:hypothetical protein